MLRKIYVAVDCRDDAERDAVQGVMNEVSNMRVLNGAQIVSMAPMVKAKKDVIGQMFGLIAQRGPQALASVQGGILIAKMLKK